MAISICTMEYEHLDEVSELEEKCFTTPWSRNSFKDAIDSANYDYIVALDDKRVVGYAGCS